MQTNKHPLLKWIENNLVAKGIIIEHFCFVVSKRNYGSFGDDYGKFYIYAFNPVFNFRFKWSLNIYDEQLFNLGFSYFHVPDEFSDEIIKSNFNQDIICDVFIKKFGGKFVKSYNYNKYFRIPKDLIELEMELAIDE